MKQKKTRTSTDVVVEILDEQGRGRAIRGLLDSGCTRTIVIKEFCSRVEKGKKITYKTMKTMFQPAITVISNSN